MTDYNALTDQDLNLAIAKSLHKGNYTFSTSGDFVVIVLSGGVPIYKNYFDPAENNMFIFDTDIIVSFDIETQRWKAYNDKVEATAVSRFRAILMAYLMATENDN